MIRYLALLLVIAAAPLAQARGAEAQTITSPYEFVETRHAVGPYLGHLSTSRGDIGQGPAPAPIFGARYVIRFTGPLYGEAALGGVSTNRTVLSRPVAAADTTPPVAIGKADMFLLLGEAGLRFNITGPRTWNAIAPYLSGTVGGMVNLSGSGELDEAIPQEQRVPLGPSFALGLGAGTDWFLTERFSLRAEARDYLWRLTAPAGLTRSFRQESQWTHNIALTFGGAIHF